MNTLVFFSLTALIIFTINMILAHIPGVQAKKWWKPLHIFNFIGFFLVVFHAYFIGSNSSDPLYMSLYAVFLVLALSGAFIRFFTQIKKMKNGKPIPSPATPTLASQSQPTNPSKKPASPTTVPLHDEQFNVVKGRE